jgi:CheY-like chemotaxis protein/nitrogen-specific signal transduction histidine kinase
MEIPQHCLVVYEPLGAQLSNALKNIMLMEQTQQARREAERADLLKTRLLANVSHELRTPLNVILGYCTAALDTPNPYQVELPPLLREDLARIFRSGEHLIRLINDLLDLSRAEIGELELFPEIVAPIPLLKEVFENIQQAPPINAQVTWELKVPDRLPLLQADPLRLRQILLNLLSNAKKFTLQGRIVLGAEVVPPNIHLWIQDTGLGIPLEQQERIFEPFATLPAAGRRPEGIGLGLSITRRLVALHAGTMRLDSQPGQGSVFHLYFPLSEVSGHPAREALPPSQASLLALSTCGQPAAPIIQLCEVSRLQYRPLSLGDDLEQVVSSLRPAAIAWDMNCATPADWELVSRIRNHPLLARLPFIVFGREENEPACPEVGVTGVLTKPVSQTTLLEYIFACRPPQSGGSILIVDDDPAARALYRDLAARALPGLPVLEAENGFDALTQMQRASLSLIILDLVMPEMDGFTLLAKIRQNEATRQTPVLVMSGKSLTLEDVRRLNFAGVIFQGKGVLSEAELAGALQRVLGSENALPAITSVLVKRALAFLHQNFARPISRREIARTVGVNESYLSKIFSAEVGIPVWEYLTRLRVQTACVLLRTTQKSVTEIGGQVGFEDSAYFCRVFHRYMGVPPQKYRN